MRLNDRLLKDLCRKLVERDPDIVEIVQFGSSVYARERARDLDLLVFTKARKDYGAYLDAACDVYDELDFPYNIDVVPFEVGEQLNRCLAVQVMGGHTVLYGDGSFLRKATGWVDKGFVERLKIDPIFEEARVVVRAAQDYMGLASSAEDPMLRDRHTRQAFNSLFHAARIASMAYLSTEDARWGRVKRKLPKPHGEEFGRIIDKLHIKYFYDGKYPRETVEEEFQRWLKRVEEYIEGLEAEAEAKKA